MGAILRRHRLLQLARLAFFITAAWAFLGVFFASQAHAIAVARGYPEDGNERALHTIAVCIVWALLTPVVIYIADRLPLRAPHRARNIVLLIAIGGFAQKVAPAHKVYRLHIKSASVLLPSSRRSKSNNSATSTDRPTVEEIARAIRSIIPRVGSERPAHNPSR